MDPFPLIFNCRRKKIDSNHTNIAKAKEDGLEAINTNIYSDSLADNIELNDMGYLIALTGSSDINKYAINKFRNQFGEMEHID